MCVRNTTGPPYTPVMRRILIGIAVLTLVGAACKAEANVIFEIQADGSGSIGAEIGFDDELMGLIGDENIGEGFFTDLDVAGLGDAVTERREGDFTYFTTSSTFADAAELEQLIQQEDDLPFQGRFNVEISDDELRIDAATDDTSALVDSDALFGFDETQLEQFFSAHVRIRVPGSVESNADRTLTDGTLEWDIPIDGGPLAIEVIADLSDSGGFPWPILLLVATLAIAAVVGYLIVQQRRRPALGIPTHDTPPASAAPPGDLTAPEDTSGAATVSIEEPPPPPE